MYQDKIESYLASKGINSSYNTLGSTSTLVNLFVKETAFIIDKSASKNSNFIKHQLYSNYYDFERRPKFTGFEKFSELDKQFRIDNAGVASGVVGTPVTIVELSPEEFQEKLGLTIEETVTPIEITGLYLEELKNTLKTLINPLVYMSGGLDSEFVARAMLDASIQFKVVIFRLTDEKHDVLNAEDIHYALDFCEEHGIVPIINTICVPNLWNSEMFIDIAKGTTFNSPQLNTHAYMAEVMAAEFPDSTHIFGGEIRVTAQYKTTESTLSVVNAVKNPSPGFGSYQVGLVSASPLIGTGMSITITFNYNGNPASNQTWSAAGSPNYSGSPNSGNWFLAQSGPTSGFQYSWGPDEYGNWTWDGIGVGTTGLVVSAAVTTGYVSFNNFGTGTFYVRGILDPATYYTYSMTTRTYYTYTGPAPGPMLLTYDTPYVGAVAWLENVNYGYQNVTAMIVGAGGAGGAAIGTLFNATGGGGHGGQVLTTTQGPGNILELITGVGYGGTNTNNVIYTNGEGSHSSGYIGAYGPTTWSLNAAGGPTSTSGNGGSGGWSGAPGGGAPYYDNNSAGGGGGNDSAGVSASGFTGGAGGAGHLITLGLTSYTYGGGGGGGAYSGTAGTGTDGGGTGGVGSSGGVVGDSGTRGGGGGGSFAAGLAGTVAGGTGGGGVVLYYMTV